MPARPSLIALGVLRRSDDSVLLTATSDPATGQPFYRPVGGHVEAGETAAVTLVREFAEELGVDVAVTRYLCTLENIFTFAGKPGHEVDLVFELAFADPADYDRPRFPRLDDPPAAPRHAVWVALPDLVAGPTPLYPTGLLAALTDSSAPPFFSSTS